MYMVNCQNFSRVYFCIYMISVHTSTVNFIHLYGTLTDTHKYILKRGIFGKAQFLYVIKGIQIKYNILNNINKQNTVLSYEM